MSQSQTGGRRFRLGSAGCGSRRFGLGSAGRGSRRLGTDIRRYATQFYKGLFNTELVEDPELDASFLSDLTHVEATTNSQLGAKLTVEELHVALMSLANRKAPGIDGLPVDFYKAFWPLLGQAMLEVFQDSFQGGHLPLSCRRAVIKLLPKKGDLQHQ